jgi:hypothetical protein
MQIVPTCAPPAAGYLPPNPAGTPQRDDETNPTAEANSLIGAR